MKKPIASRSARSSSSADHAGDVASGGGASPPAAGPKRPICCAERSSARAAPQRRTSSRLASRRARLRSRESKAPHLTRLSTTRRFTSWLRTRRQKSWRLVKGPSARAAMIVSIAFEPTPFTAPRPKRIVSPATVKSSRLWLTSGGRIGMLRSRHSARFLYVLSVSPASRERRPAMNSRGRLRDLHHLLLVDDDAVGVAQDRLERGVQIADRLLAVLAADEGVDHGRAVVELRVERPRPVERQDGDEVGEARGPELRQQPADAARLELEDPDRVAVGEQLVGAGVVQRQAIGAQLDAAPP